jgi:hypothetical protein
VLAALKIGDPNSYCIKFGSTTTNNKIKGRLKITGITYIK